MGDDKLRCGPGRMLFITRPDLVGLVLVAVGVKRPFARAASDAESTENVEVVDSCRDLAFEGRMPSELCDRLGSCRGGVKLGFCAGCGLELFGMDFAERLFECYVRECMSLIVKSKDESLQQPCSSFSGSDSASLPYVFGFD